jgi:RecB family exonuclease
MTLVTPRRSQLIRADSLRAMQDVLVGLVKSGDAQWAAETFVLVPTRAAGEQLRRTVEDRLLERQPAMAWPQVGTRSDWYQAMLGRIPAQGTTISPVEREAILGRVAREVSRDVVAPPFALRPALTADMLALYDLIRRQARTIDDFERNFVGELEPAAESDRGAAQLLTQTQFLAATYRRYEAHLAEHALSDEHVQRTRLIETVPVRPLRRVVVTVGDRISDPDGLWPVDFMLLSTLPDLADVSVVMTEQIRDAGLLERLHAAMPGIVEVKAADVPGLTMAPATLPVLVTPATPDPAPHGTVQASAVFVARDREEELRHVARRLKAARHDAVPLHRKALVVRRPLPYLYLIRAVFSSARIPFEMTDALPLAAEPYAAAVDLVLECVTSDFSRSTLVALLQSPHFSWQALGGALTRDDLRECDQALAEVRYLGGRESLTRLATQWSAATGDDRISSRRRRAAAACHVAAQVADALAPLADERPVEAQTELLHQFLVTHRQVEVSEPHDERRSRAQHAVYESLRQLGRAARVHDPEAVVSAASLSQTLRHWLEGRTFDMRTEPGGIRLLDAQSARYADVDEMHLLGLIEGEWPEPVRSSIFYGQSLLSLLEPTPVAIAPAQREHQLRTSALAAFRDLLVLPRQTLSASTFQLEADSLVSPSPYVQHLSTFGTQTRVDTTASDSRVTADEALMDVPPDAGGMPEMTAAWAALRSATPDTRAGIFHGQAGTTELRSISVSRIDTYLKCPFKYFAQYVLRLEEEATDEETQSPLRRGNFLHRVLEQCYLAWEQQGGTTIHSENRTEARRVFETVIDRLLGELPPDEAGLERLRLLGTAMAPGMVDRVLDDDASHGVPVARRWSEFSLDGVFAFRQEDDSVRHLHLKGKVDRVDLLQDGTFRIIDYKTGSTPKTADTVQLQVYAAAVAQTLAAQHRTGRTLASARFLSLTGPTARSASLPVKKETMAQSLREGERRLLEVVDCISSGKFPPKPITSQTCAYCAYASVCRKDIVGDDEPDDHGESGADD